jgi:plasmid stabilization system protein ParE
VRRLVYRSAALRDLAGIAAYIERESGSRGAAEAFIDKLTDHCERIARFPTMVGRPRPELRPDYRSLAFGKYVIFLRYAEDEGEGGHLYVGNIIHARRDIDAYFVEQGDEDADI